MTLRNPIRRPLALALAIPLSVSALGAAALPGPASSGAQDGTRGKVAGLGISRPGLPQQVIANDLPRMRKTGVNTGMIDVWWDVKSATASTMSRGTITTPDADILLAMQRARAVGMKVMFEPKLWCPSCKPRHWRGNLTPRDRKTFFKVYRSMINHYAALAQQGGAEVLFVGSEMNSVQDSTAEWREVVRQARRHFGGRIAYKANWDAWDKVKFWDAVDVVSVSAYFPLSDAERPSVAELKAGWRSSRAKKYRGRAWFNEMRNLARATKKPVLFGECGYLSSTYAARRPYDESQRFQADQQVQANAYQALLETFEAEPWWMGVVWWEWVPDFSDPATARTYTPRDKLAEKFLTAWYAEGKRPVVPGGPPTATPGGAAGAGTGTGAAALEPNGPGGSRPASAVTRGDLGDAEPGGKPLVATVTVVKAMALVLLVAASVGHRRLVVRTRRLRRMLRSRPAA